MSSFKKIRFSLVFNRLGKLNRYGEGIIQVRAYQNKRCRYFTTGVYIQPEFWSDRNQRVAIGHPTHFVLNKMIQGQLECMEAFEITMINRHGGLPLDRLHEYDLPSVNEVPRSFTAFFENELTAANYKPSSHKMYLLTFRKLKAFREVVYFEDVRYKLALDFDRFLRRQGLGGNSIHKHHSRLSTFVKAAIRQDYLPADANPYAKFRPSRGEEPKRVYLTSEELAKVETLQLVDSTVSHVRDMFLLCCYTGLRYGTATNLTTANIDERKQGLVITTKAEKTGKRLELPLHLLFQDGEVGGSRPERIIRRHLGKMGSLLNCSGVERIRLFPYTNQFVNRNLKEIARLAGITKDVATHAARRTFATQMATRVKAPVLQRLLQHARPDMTAIYVQLSNTAIEEELGKIRWE